MYLLTDSEADERAATTMENSLLKELKSMLFETGEDESSTEQTFEAGEYR